MKMLKIFNNFDEHLIFLLLFTTDVNFVHFVSHHLVSHHLVSLKKNIYLYCRACRNDRKNEDKYCEVTDFDRKIVKVRCAKTYFVSFDMNVFS